jgi:hypothetical protein
MVNKKHVKLDDFNKNCLAFGDFIFFTEAIFHDPER